MQIEHASNAIKTETVEVILIHPESEITKEKAHDLMMTIVEQATVPLVMTALATTVEILVVGAIKLIKTVQNIFRRMTVDYIQQYNQPKPMGSINKLLQILWRAVSTASCEKAVDLIAKTRIIGMFHDCHELDDVVAEIFDTG